jgi:cyclophilin family peptidyl-prolyl cis-trans isomerase
MARGPKDGIDPFARKIMKLPIIPALLVCLTLISGSTAAAPVANPTVRMITNLGVIEIELDARRAPKTTANFLHYVDDGFYNGTIFHRVISGFMIQGGGFKPGLDQKKTDAPIMNEADNGLKNVTGTIAMARTSSPHSASAQFFINTADNAFLNHRDKTMQGWGYAVFGRVTKGMGVVKKIEMTPTHTVGHYRDVPRHDVVIEKVERIKN